MTNNGGDVQLSNVRDGSLTVPKTNEIQSVLETNGTLVPTSSYMIPEKFNTVKGILKYYNDEVGVKGYSKDNKWRYHLSYAQNKIFTRMKRFVWCYRNPVLRDSMSEEEVLCGFEEYLLANKQ